MRVKMLTSVASPAFSHVVGEVVELSDAVAESWCASGLAEPIAAPSESPKAPARKAAPRKPAARKS